MPLIPTHIQDVKKARAAIQTLLNEPEIFPFVLPIKFGQKIASNSSIYFKLVQHAILLLLGWLLPRPNDKTSVDIFLEHISGYEDGHEETEFFKILTSALNLLANESRFSHWEINNVEWVGKDFQYVPYGDLVCKTCVPHPDKRQLASDVNLNRWPGFLPFSPTVFQILHALDSDSPAGFADHLAHLATTHKRTPLFRNVLQHAIQRAKKDVAFRDALFEKFENCYKQANRDISGLNDLVHPFLISLPVETFSGTPRILFLRVLVELQNANHNGTPEKLGCVLDNYTSLRNRMIELDRELCVDADLNLAVHYHDLFDFQRGADLANAWISDSLFPALSIASRGKLYSSLGQSLALLGHGTDADRAFVTALTFFSQEEELYEKEIDQTSVYRALNMLDFNSHAAIPLVEYTLKHPLIEIAQKPGTFLTSPFHEYLFLKTLWVLRDVDHIKTIIRTFLSQINTWPPQQPCHPYELILFYRALLLKPHNVFAAQTIALKIGALYSMMEHGDVLMLILVAIRSILASNGIDLSAALSQILPSPSVLKTKMPCAAKYIDRLVQDSAPHDEEKSKFLPFYYT